jgi:ketosteroid isomerase-like protein
MTQGQRTRSEAGEAMSDEVENRATIETFWQAYNEERIDDCIKMYAPRARLRHFSQGIDVSGTDAIRNQMDAALTAVPGRRMRVNNILSARDSVVAETRFEGTPAGSSEHLAIDMCYIYDFEDGKVVDVREYT